MSLDRRANEIERIVGELAREVPRELAIYLKDQFEKFLPQILGHSTKAEMRVVLDASSAVAEVRAFVKKGDSVLVRLANEPFLKLYAPPEIVPEVENRLREIASKEKLNFQRLLDVWKTRLLPLVVVQRPESMGAWFKGMIIMGERDIKDVPYVALSFDFETHGVITQDRDMLDQPQIRTWRMGKVRQVVTVMKKGSLMFVASSELLFPLLIAIFQATISLLKAIYDFVMDVARAISQAIKDAIGEIEKMPDLVKLALLLVAAWVLTRPGVMDQLRTAADTVARFVREFIDAIRGIINFLAPLIEIPIAVTLILLKDIGEALVELQSLSSNA